jgi:hypothetical protein
LESAPARFGAALARLEDADSVVGGAPEEWSPAQVMAHVRAANDILEPRILQILVRDEPPIAAFDERRWSEVARYDTLPVTELLSVMRARRRELVRALRAISAEDWERAGRHEVKGRVTVLDVARHIADHDDEHIEQIAQAAGMDEGRRTKDEGR